MLVMRMHGITMVNPRRGSGLVADEVESLSGEAYGRALISIFAYMQPGIIYCHWVKGTEIGALAAPVSTPPPAGA